ncbi:permease [Candidatus Woesearchaeota archaeon]|nr:MAG: permease [Candidatus Woesearchaeota archaeon]
MQEIDVASFFGLEGKLAESMNFFITDSISILFMLFVMIFIMGVIRTYIPQKKIRKYLDGKKGILGNIFASMFGALTPFCSCSSIPIFLSFLEAGIPLGITFSFLITSPLINEYLVVLMLGFFGWKITAIYILSGLSIGIISGYILGKMDLEKELVKDVISKRGMKEKIYTFFKGRLRFGLNEAISIVKKLWIWILIGVGIGAIIHNFVPEEMIHSIIVSVGIFGVPIAVILGVPLYGSCAAIVPIALVLFQKGVPLGTALSFMMAISALSFPEAIILRRAMNLKLIAIFFGIVTIGIIIIGYLLNLIQFF